MIDKNLRVILQEKQCKEKEGVLFENTVRRSLKSYLVFLPSFS